MTTAAPASPTARRGRSPRHAAAAAAVFVAYVALTLAIVYRTPVLSLDRFLYGLDLRHSLPEGFKRWISWYVALGQRGPATAIFLPVFLWIARRERSTRPLVMLATALVLLNASVAVVKYSIGRLGPLRTPHAHAIFDGGNIYPSGHISNAVVLYGLIAWIVVEHRRLLIGATVFLAATIGLGTIYLNTHWFSDVVGGWLAGALVLLALPWFTPTTQRWADAGVAAWRRGRERGRERARRPAVPARVVHRPAPLAAPPVTVR